MTKYFKMIFELISLILLCLGSINLLMHFLYAISI